MNNKEKVIIQTNSIRVRIMELTPGEATPCHHHTEITDNIFGLSGEMEIQLKNPDETIKLSPGTRREILPERIHMVINLSTNQKATYLLVQGCGRYDFILDD